jgi:hypothetical protein
MYRHILESAPNLRETLPEAVPQRLQDVPPHLRLFDDGTVSVIYAPIDYVNRAARLVILGITPGWHQAHLAFETSIAMRATPHEIVGPEVKRRAAFAGSMRRNLIAMLDELSVHELLGITSTAQLFAERSDLLHSSSAFRYPVFTSGKNFSGYNPDPLKHTFLVGMLEELLAPELSSVPNALVVPLGQSVERALEYLTERNVLPSTRWLRGFPHPSGSNGHRKRLFALRKDALALAARHWLSRPTQACN